MVWFGLVQLVWVFLHFNDSSVLYSVTVNLLLAYLNLEISDGVIRVGRSLKSYGNCSMLMHGFHHGGVCFLEDTVVRSHVKEATQFQPEKCKAVVCQLVFLANVLKFRKALYCLQIHVTHTSTQAEILCGYR